ncbi:amidohydrolase [Niastella caeni]|uniref:Amidohydrolase n=1 Tax=Niastella caeni TaxID=2569763 RepID=A0A4S8HRY6_9BACT|nr:amidohydrolase family protein [Niastella caeni]THU35852.1 amidohydrolase [Niastella caeni]
MARLKLLIKITVLILMCQMSLAGIAQETFPVNGISNPKIACYAFTNATIVQDPARTIANGTLVIRNGRIISVGDKQTPIPKEAEVIDCSGKYIYASFLDLFSGYGTPAVKKAPQVFTNTPQFISNTKGAYGWNQAIKSEVNACDLFTINGADAKKIRDAGFGSVVIHQMDGIARGTGALVTPGSKRENELMIKEKAAAFYSFDKGSSTQTYPFSLMGSIALLRQTFLDARWYKTNPAGEGVNLSLKAWNAQQTLPQIFSAENKWDVLRADKTGDEFGVQYIIKADGNEYQRMAEMKATNASFILPVDFPLAMDLEDPADARYVSLADMKHWEMAPTQPAAFEKAGITFCFTPFGLKDVKDFIPNIRKAIQYGLSEQKALEALTTTPARIIGTNDLLGSLETGKIANLLITSGPLFEEQTIIYQNWIQGDKYAINEDALFDVRGSYNMVVNNAGNGINYTLQIGGSVKIPAVTVIHGNDTLPGKINVEGQTVSLTFPCKKGAKQQILLSGTGSIAGWNGVGRDTAGTSLYWTAKLIQPAQSLNTKQGDALRKISNVNAAIYYPFNGYGWENKPEQQTLLIKNTTVWTNEKEGRLQNRDVLIKNGKIAQVGKDLTAPGARIIDGTNKHLTAGIIDEHSHIAISGGVNEGSNTVTAEVRIEDVLNPDDINIYRQLSGGVTASHILPGSSNLIGGQSQLIKLRWGAGPEQLKFGNNDPFIKFALGENVKHSNRSERPGTRFPQTRMGVEQALIDVFTRAGEYAKKGNGVRKDLTLDALVEVLYKKRFITSHSYVQSEITMLMEVAERFGFRVNTFTHGMEGYKVAGQLKQHGAGVGTFSDRWAFKMEVVDGIPYNANILSKVGVITAINSDDAEMARRLNQEGAKMMKYGGMSEEEAVKLVTLNPAQLLHITNRVGSIKEGKDADLVLWSDHPLSIYAKAEKTMVDGIIYFDIECDRLLRKRISEERNRLIQKMIAEKKKGGPLQKAKATEEEVWSCEGLYGEEEQL